MLIIAQLGVAFGLHPSIQEMCSLRLEYLAPFSPAACLDAFLWHWLVLYEALEYRVESIFVNLDRFLFCHSFIVMKDLGWG